MLKVCFHHVGRGLCSLTGKEGDGLTVTFEDGTVKNQFLTHRAFRQLLTMKLAPLQPEPTVPEGLLVESAASPP